MSHRDVKKLCLASVGVLKLGFMKGRAGELLEEGVGLQSEFGEEIDYGLVVMVAKGLESTAGKLLQFCIDNGVNPDDHMPT